MSDIGDDDITYTRRAHRCTPKRSRRGKPRDLERASCECGQEFVWQSRPFAQWLPVFSTVDR